jgi:AAA+ ATPase superfamily predicted ATPase
MDASSGKLKVGFDMQPSDEQATLKEVFEYLGSSEKRCYIARDEFQQVAEYPEQGLEAALRSYIQFLPNVNFIFSGSSQHIMQEIFLGAKRPFYQSTQIVTIGSIDRHAYYEFAAAFFAERGTELSEDVFSLIYNEFEGHTWYVQAILNRLYGYSGKPDGEAVNRAIGQIIDENSYAYQTLLAAYSHGSVRLLKAIAKEGVVLEINSGEFIARHGLKAASSVNSALRRLIDRELVYKSPAGYMVYDRFMALWLRGQAY